ncbi:hypothetical protein MMB75_05935 [Paenibacillus sp. P2(2022)]|uniref:hypothetical protein n=1 Tax=Paenibacillus TaxID=44249 RepID=UPI0005EC0551|nr:MULTISPECIES: hypothetical protein [Paenibacillus]KJK30867.1 hypothetical protein TY89_11960 [Paenibacillus polymyxa]MDG0053212.1 hypothetical protein [Paenibacillus sp. P2(2022)]
MNSMSSFWTLFIVVDLIIFWFIFRAIRRNRGNRSTRRRNAFFLSSPSPSSLTQERHPEITELKELLERSIPASYAHNVKQRVMEAHPNLTEQEYDWRWHELKRYFMLCAIMNRVPMFSSDVDELWHEMLMFTREYQQFSGAFFGRMLHHAPHSGGSQLMPEERAWFDWLYVECFGWNRYSASLWGTFFNHPLPNDELSHYYNLTASAQPVGDRWNISENIGISKQTQQAVHKIVQHLRERVNKAVNDPEGKQLPKINYLQVDYLLLAVVWYSWYRPDEFAIHMHPDSTSSVALASSSGCSSASGCSNWDTHHSHHHSSHDSSHGGGSSHHDSGDSGSHSSCSSGSSCGSSCGGGGD